MKVLVTGAKGFIGKNLVSQLKNKKIEVLEYDMDSNPDDLNKFTAVCDVVVHLAGINRPEKTEDFAGNPDFTSTLLQTLKKSKNKATVIVSSSTQAALDNPYGKSKKNTEDVLLEYAKNNNSKVLIYRFPNVFGKWCKPNYNSVIATFCNNIANNKEITINDENTKLTLVYIDDVVTELINATNGNANSIDKTYCAVPTQYQVTLGEIAATIRKFKTSRKDLQIPNMTGFEKALYSTYLTYLPVDDFSYPLDMKQDARGNFSEILKSPERGQFSVNTSKPGATKGNHWHQSKNEKFLVVSGSATIKLRKINEEQIIEYHVCGDKHEVIDIPPGYTHNVTNTGDTDMVMLIWANEVFNQDNPDTYYEEV